MAKEDLISKQHLLKLMHLREDSLYYNIQKGKLPIPVKINNECFFRKKDIEEIFERKSLDESFITKEEARKFLNLDKNQMSAYIRKDLLPFYSLLGKQKRGRGTNYLFLKSELQLVLDETILIQNHKFINLKTFYNYFIRLVGTFLDTDYAKKRFKKNEYDVLNDIFLLGFGMKSLAKKHNLSYERIRQIFHTGFRKLAFTIRTLPNYIELYEDEKRKNREILAEKEYILIRLKKTQTRLAKYETIIKKDQDIMKSIKKERFDLLSKKLVYIDFSVRVSNILREARIETVEDLIKYSKDDLLKFQNFGLNSLAEVEKFLESIGYEQQHKK